MRFTPKSAEEVTRDTPVFTPWPAGNYDFEIASAEEARSSAGNDMVKLTVLVFNDAGRQRKVFDNLVATEKAVWKIAQFAASVDMMRQYESGELYADEMVGKTGHLRLMIQKDAQYGDQNKVAEYLTAAKKPAQKRAGIGANIRETRREATADLGDEIPF